MADKTPHSSRPVLEAWLEKVGAVFRWQEWVLGFGALRRYVANDRTFLLHDKQQGDRDFGWEIYVPAFDGNDAEKTLEAAEIALALRPRTPAAITLTTAQVMDVANVLSHLRREHSIDPDPVVGILKVEDFRFIAESVNAGWNTYDTARELAGLVRARQQQ